MYIVVASRNGEWFYFGPFESRMDARMWAESILKECIWSVELLQKN